MDLKCRKTECKFNDNFVCKARNISISTEVECLDFVMGDEKTPDTSKNLYKKEPHYARQRKCKCGDIVCDANCEFNNNRQCEANGITVNSIKEKPYCVTFLKRL